MTPTWEQVFETSMSKKQADELVERLKKIAEPDRNGICDAEARPNPLTDGYGVYVKRMR